MQKEEILEKSRKTGEDERVHYLEEKAVSASGWSVIFSIAVFMIIRAIYSLKVDDLLAILLSYLSVQYFYKFYGYKRALWLTLGIVFLIGALIFGVIYIINLGGI